MLLKPDHLPRYPSGIVADKSLPSAVIFIPTIGVAGALIMMAKGNRQRVRDVQIVGHSINIQQPVKHSGNLFLGCPTFAGDRLFYPARRIFENRYVTVKCRRNSHTLRTPKLKHRLYILTIKRMLNGQLIRVKMINIPQHRVEDPFQLQWLIADPAKFNHIHGNKTDNAAIDADNTQAHIIRSGVYAEDDLVVFQNSGR